MTLYHLTVNTGHVADLPRPEVWEPVRTVLAPLIKRGGGTVPALSPWKVSLAVDEGIGSFSIARRDEAATLNVVAWTPDGAEQAWSLVNQVRRDIYGSTPLPPMPTVLPWLATLILPGIAFAAEDDVSWMGDFERCMGWAMIGENGHE